MPSLKVVFNLDSSDNSIYNANCFTRICIESFKKQKSSRVPEFKYLKFSKITL